MRPRKTVHRKSSSLIPSTNQSTITMRGSMHQTAASIRHASRKAALTESVLILVKGDPLSKDVKAIAKKAGFSGYLLELSLREAALQATPLPLLVTKTFENCGPDGLLNYFRKKKK